MPVRSRDVDVDWPFILPVSLGACVLARKCPTLIKIALSLSLPAARRPLPGPTALPAAMRIRASMRLESGSNAQRCSSFIDDLARRACPHGLCVPLRRAHWCKVWLPKLPPCQRVRPCGGRATKHDRDASPPCAHQRAALHVRVPCAKPWGGLACEEWSPHALMLSPFAAIMLIIAPSSTSDLGWGSALGSSRVWASCDREDASCLAKTPHHQTLV